MHFDWLKVWKTFNKWTKIYSLEITILNLKMMVKIGLEFFNFEIHRSPSELPANMPGQFRISVDFFTLGSNNSEGAR